MYISVQSVSDAWWLSAKRSASDTVAKRKDWGLEDPTGQSDEVFLETIHKIEENILQLKEKLGEPV